VRDKKVRDWTVSLFLAPNLKVFDTVRTGGTMPDPLSVAIDGRSALLRQVSELGDFQPGSISCPTRRCGKPSCHCAKPNDPGHGPHYQLTQKIDGKTVTQNLPSPAAIRKAESEVAEYRKFQGLIDDLVEVNRKICRLRPVEQAEQTAQEKKRPKRSSRKSPKK
jgi:hypothetical protein